MSIDFPVILNFFIAVVAILNPIGNVPIFLEHVNQDSTDVQKNIAKLLALSIFIICTFFFFIGQPFLSLFGISIPAFRIAGGILIMTIGFRMLHGKPKFENEGLETNASSVSAFKQATERLSSLIVPLAMPIFAGPGAIATVILYAQKPNNFLTMIGMVFALAAACALIGLVLYLSRWLFRILKNNGMQIVSRTMGLILCAIAVQFVVQGIAQLIPGLIDPAYVQS